MLPNLLQMSIHASQQPLGLCCSTIMKIWISDALSCLQISQLIGASFTLHLTNPLQIKLLTPLQLSHLCETWLMIHTNTPTLLTRLSWALNTQMALHLQLIHLLMNTRPALAQIGTAVHHCFVPHLPHHLIYLLQLLLLAPLLVLRNQSLMKKNHPAC